MNVLEKVKSVNWLLQLKLIATGSAVVAPIAVAIYAIKYAVDTGLLSGTLVLNTLQVILGVFFLWTVGGLVQSVHSSRQAQKEYKEKKTLRAFEKLAGGKL